jgi:hypothetical protein
MAFLDPYGSSKITTGSFGIGPFDIIFGQLKKLIVPARWVKCGLRCKELVG